MSCSINNLSFCDVACKILTRSHTVLAVAKIRVTSCYENTLLVSSRHQFGRGVVGSYFFWEDGSGPSGSARKIPANACSRHLPSNEVAQ